MVIFFCFIYCWGELFSYKFRDNLIPELILSPENIFTRGRFQLSQFWLALLKKIQDDGVVGSPFNNSLERGSAKGVSPWLKPFLPNRLINSGSRVVNRVSSSHFIVAPSQKTTTLVLDL